MPKLVLSTATAFLKSIFWQSVGTVYPLGKETVLVVDDWLEAVWPAGVELADGVELAVGGVAAEFPEVELPELFVC